MAKRNRMKQRLSVRGSVKNTEAAEALRELGGHVYAAALEALKESADEVVQRAKELCPVGDGSIKPLKKGTGKAHPGRLRDSIKATPNNDGSVYVISADAESDDGFPYGQIIEFAPNGQPFLYPAFDQLRDKVRENIADAIKNAVQQGAKK